MSEFMWIPGSHSYSNNNTNLIIIIIITDAEATFFLNMTMNPFNDFPTRQKKKGPSLIGKNNFKQ